MSDEVQKTKQPRFRSPPYPAISLDKAIERATSFYSKALHHPVPVGVAANAWDYAEKSSGLFATVAALKQFGLMADEGSGDKRRFKLTDTGMRIVRDPDPKSEKRIAAVRKAVLAPKIHAELWDKYESAGASGAMDVALKSYLTIDRSEEGAAAYSDSAADELIAEYRNSITFAGLLEPQDVSFVEDVDEDSGNLGTDEGSGDKARELPKSQAQPPISPHHPPEENTKVMQMGERELTTGLLSKESGFRLIVHGKVGPKEIQRLINKLELDKEILADQEEDEPKPKRSLI